MVQNNNFQIQLQEIIHENPDICYQCGKCSAGCPLRIYMKEPPNLIIRYVQLGLYDLALNSSTIWLCAGCQTCSTRCPKNFDLAKFMDGLREIALVNNIPVKEKKILKFHKAFLKQIKKYGRSYELGLVMDYKLKTGDFMSDVDSAPSLVLNGKLSFLPHKVKGKDKIKNIFNKINTKKCK
jgi:heterodisulfide reductase subunit C